MDLNKIFRIGIDKWYLKNISLNYPSHMKKLEFVNDGLLREELEIRESEFLLSSFIRLTKEGDLLSEATILTFSSRRSYYFKYGRKGRTIKSYFLEARVAPGTYDLMECIDIYVETTLNKNYGEEIKIIEKNTKKLKLEILEGKYHKVEDVKRIVLDMLSNFKSKLTVLPIKLGQDLLGEDLITK